MPETMNHTGAASARSFAAAGAASTSELIEEIRRQLGPTSARRVGMVHATLLHTLIEMEEDFADVNAIYRALLANGNAMVMSKLYRALKVLEEARAIERHWAPHDGRPRSVYCVAGRARQAGHDHEAGVCRFCGVPLHG